MCFILLNVRWDKLFTKGAFSPFIMHVWEWISALRRASNITAPVLCSGLAAGADPRIVLQVRLRCTEGYVRWVYPGQGLRVALEPNLSSIRYNTVCMQPSPSLNGTSVFIERAGHLKLLLMGEGGRTGRQVFCFRADWPQRPVIYLQTAPHSPGAWSRRTVGFRYELLRNKSANGGLQGESGAFCVCVCVFFLLIRGEVN